MKLIVTITRVIVGVLFIFSGLMKAIDPWGLTYSTQEFFEVFRNAGIFPSLINLLYPYTFYLSLFMIALETLVGVALLLGICKKSTLAMLFLLIIFFTFLTGYAYFTGTVKECGCFGSCFPLTPIQTFLKNIVLLFFILLLFFGHKFILPVFSSKSGGRLFSIAIIGICYLQFYVLKHLPIIDCLHYRIGSNIAELRKMPKDAIPDKYDYVFIYEKGGVKKEFSVSALPDSSWHFIDRKQTIIEKGKNNVPLISDFTLSKTDSTGTTDVTDSILNQHGEYYLLFVKDFVNSSRWLPDFYTFYTALSDKSKIYIVSSNLTEANNIFDNSKNPIGIQIFICDATAIKTAARANPTLYKMNGPVVVNKWSWADFDDAFKK